jgi:hypothetical protein
MVLAVLSICPHCQARIHPRWVACAACRAPLESGMSAPIQEALPAVPLMYVPSVSLRPAMESTPPSPPVSPPVTGDPPGTVRHMWSTILGCEFWIMETDAQAKAQRAQGRAAYSQREVGLLQTLREHRPDTFPETLKTLHTYRDVFEATLEIPEDTPAVARTRAAPLTASDVRVAVRTAMGQGLRVWREGETWHLEDTGKVLPARVRERLNTSESQQIILEACYSLGPILPPCGICGGLRLWLDRDADTWRCWACVPPPLRTAVTASAEEVAHAPGGGTVSGPLARTKGATEPCDI